MQLVMNMIHDAFVQVTRFITLFAYMLHETIKLYDSYLYSYEFGSQTPMIKIQMKGEKVFGHESERY